MCVLFCAPVQFSTVKLQICSVQMGLDQIFDFNFPLQKNINMELVTNNTLA